MISWELKYLYLKVLKNGFWVRRQWEDGYGIGFTLIQGTLTLGSMVEVSLKRPR